MPLDVVKSDSAATVVINRPERKMRSPWKWAFQEIFQDLHQNQVGEGSESYIL
jgi:hypothetical protein